MRYQVKFRRRRQAKTDYSLRRRLIRQDKRKYNAPKWRFIVRVTNKDVICQVASARVVGDRVICAAYGHELPRYGLKVGLTNYSACYCTGLLCARRLLNKLGLDKIYKGKRRINGNMFRSRVQNVMSKFEAGRILRPFRCILDVGLRRTTSGAKIFGALKGAVDGGLDIPHKNRRFPGFTKAQKGEGGKDEYDAEALRKKIFGDHVSSYMKHLQEGTPEKYAKHFARYIKEGVEADNLEDLYKRVHSNIRRDPTPSPKKKKAEKEQLKNKWSEHRKDKLSLDERKQRRNEKIHALLAAAQEQKQDAEGDVAMAES
jgi:large subunit ribosomal protein L5e